MMHPDSVLLASLTCQLSPISIFRISVVVLAHFAHSPIIHILSGFAKQVIIIVKMVVGRKYCIGIQENGIIVGYF